AAERGLAAARFPNEAYDLALGDSQVDAVDGLDDLFLDARTEPARDLLRHVQSSDEALADSVECDDRCMRPDRSLGRRRGSQCHSAASWLSRCGWKQRTVRPAMGMVMSGAVLQISLARGQRVRKAQPSGRSRSDGVIPG